jgi:chitin-binding protein
MRENKKLSSACWLAFFSTLFMSSAPLSAWAHGAPEYPISRQYNCYQNPKSPACVAAISYGGEQAIYDWNGVNQANAAGNHQAVVPDGKLCAGGAVLGKGFDLARDDWFATPWSPGLNGQYEFRYYATAPHRTSSWRFYLTRQGWTPASTLRWGDMDLIAELGSAQITTTANNRYVMQLNLPPRTGRHLLYAVWQRADSTEAFYSCSDVSLGSGGGVVAGSSSLQQIGQIQAREDLAVGSTLKLRVFDRNGTDLESHTLVTTAANRLATQWLGQLAAIANRASSNIRVGELQGGQVVVPVNNTQLQVYALNANATLQFAVDKTVPNTPIGSPTAPTWAEGQNYPVGSLVTYNGKVYRSTLAHTAWVGAGWRPDVPWTQNVLWVAVLPSGAATLAQPIPWVDGQAYTVGQVVIYNGRMYRCTVAHTAWPNAGWRPDVAWVLSSFWVAL